MTTNVEIVGKFYSSFLGQSSEFVHQILQEILQELNNSNDMTGREIYKALVNQVGEGDEGKYRQRIRRRGIIREQRNILKPRNGEIDVERLDFNMYVMIIGLLIGDTNIDFLRSFKELRNRLCHYPVDSVLNDRRNMEDFYRELNLTNDIYHMYIFNLRREDLTDLWSQYAS